MNFKAIMMEFCDKPKECLRWGQYPCGFFFILYLARFARLGSSTEWAFVQTFVIDFLLVA